MSAAWTDAEARKATPRPPQPRARGAAMVAADGADSRLAGLRQSGCAKAFLPRAFTPWMEAVLLNTAGGVTGGDRIAWEAESQGGAHLSLSTQAAERAYRAQPEETGRVDARLRVGPGSRLDWLPQETILFDGARMERRLEAEMAADATLLLCEAVIFGRAAMGEVLREGLFSDFWRLRRDGTLVFADALRLDGFDALSRPGALAGAGAVATLLLAAPHADDLADRARAALGDAPGAGVSARGPGLLAARLFAPSGRALRARMIPLIACLRGAPPPKVWTL